MTAAAVDAPICVFIGPTIDLDTARAHLPGAAFLPPAAQGDIYHCAQQRPAAIAIIDGYFERVPAVWHKEVLWALSEGVPVYGASSMGALRAAELAAFGMTGIGWIFEQFASGALTDDDEVAIVHASAEDDYRAGSEAMVNIRRTLAAAVDAGILTDSDGAMLVACAKERYYPDRCWPQVVQDARTHCGDATAATLRAWLRDGRVDQKRLDALELLGVLANSDVRSPSVPWRFNHTVYWSEMIGSSILDIRSAPAQGQAVAGAEAPADAILDELRLDYGAYTSAFRSALIRTMAKLIADSFGLHGDDETVARVARRHFAALGVDSEDDLEKWMAANRLDHTDVNRLAEVEARFEQVSQRLSALTLAGVVDHLRWTGSFEALVGGAGHKREVLHAAGVETPTFDDIESDAATLYARWFADNNVPEPDNIDTWVRDSGYGDIHRFRRMLLRDSAYRRLRP